MGDEIWLDALVTVLEAGGVLEKLQVFFRPPAMIYPKNDKEWRAFIQKRDNMQARLNQFLNLLVEETRTENYKFLRKSALAKERVMKQQSLVLTEYLEELDEHIAKMQKDIKRLEMRNA